jgi:RNA polymerase sigma-70 factor (ECF subfamily)
MRQEMWRDLVALQPRLRRFAYGLTGSRDGADDLVQATYERAATRLDQWRPGSRLDSWMYRIMQSIRINQAKAERVRGSHLPPADPDLLPGADGPRDMEARLTLAAVRRFIWALPEEQKTVLLLIAVEGLSYKEAAQNLGVPMGTVTSRLARARASLKESVYRGASEPRPNLRIASEP